MIMVGRQLSALRLVALAGALGASVLMLVASQLPWIKENPVITPEISFGFGGMTIDLGDSQGLGPSMTQVLVIAALGVATLAIISLIPYLRFLCAAVLLIGGSGVALALVTINEINKAVTTDPRFGSPVGRVIGNALNHVYQLSPGPGVYILILGGTLAVISGALALLTPRSARSGYQYGTAPYHLSAGQYSPMQWQSEECAQAATPAPARSSEPPVTEAAAKHPSLYAILGLVIPGLPSLLIRKDKTIGVIQLGSWMLSWAVVLLLPMSLALPLLLFVPIWSAVTGYGDALRWNHYHGFIV